MSLVQCSRRGCSTMVAVPPDQVGNEFVCRMCRAQQIKGARKRQAAVEAARQAVSQRPQKG